MSSTTVRLDRSLGLWQLLVMGVIMVQPTAPMPPFGAISAASGGHAVSTILVAMFAMMLTALSYGRMARVYPFAGSAYTYVAREIHPSAGFLTGWSLLLDYIVNPVICTIWCAKAVIGLFPGVPYAAGVLFFALLFTMLNLRGIRATARTNEFLAAAMGVVVVWMVIASVRYLSARGGVTMADLLIPFYDPSRFTIRELSTGASVAVLTYIGFDGLSTLSEEVRDPRRTILRAIVGTCFVIGILSAIEVYVAQLVWPAAEPYPDLDTAYIHVAGRAGGPLLYSVMSWTLIVATIGSASGAMLAGARLLFGMGRDSTLPKSFFGYLEPHRRIPSRNVLLIGSICLAGAFLISYQLGAELLNFGALIGFMGVNLSSLLHYWVRARSRGDSRHWHHLAAPAAGFMVCFYLWASLNWKAKAAGLTWVAFGLIYGAWKTGGFRREIGSFEIPE